ncbi:MAG: BamA/TamA family outer membrane protein, partial [Candidatus Omnitrophica bacterium]|nr:BamA/TamA family outer membrane protein [Candidatus Omnitrophota bacterium]
EYIYPIFDFLKGVVFYDTGNVWAKKNDFGKGRLFSSAGFGVRLKTPIGPIALDYGIPFDKQPGEEKRSGGKMHFSMSRSF